MNAQQFNQLYPIGTRFTCVSHPVLPDSRVVKTIAKANDFECGSIVEINVEPYFVHIDKLKSSH